ncbi:MAG TPA: hypothetical protein VKR61_09355 [Bryobacteraceae bacterium]|nr:hypothetical protein [Bryobacteraceae bacterium]
MSKTTWLFSAVCFAAALPSGAMTKWSHQYSNITYLSVPESTHLISSTMIGAVCVDSSGNKLTLDQVTWTVDASSYQVDLTFTNAFTGTVKLSGPWPATDTSNLGDFAVAIGQSDGTKLTVCSGCSTNIARRTYNSTTYTASLGGWLQWVSFTASSVYVYLRENVATFGIADEVCAGSYNSSGGVNVECGIASMPSGVVPLGSAAISGGTFTSVTDLRPW